MTDAGLPDTEDVKQRLRRRLRAIVQFSSFSARRKDHICWTGGFRQASSDTIEEYEDEHTLAERVLTPLTPGRLRLKRPRFAGRGVFRRHPVAKTAMLLPPAWPEELPASISDVGGH